MGFTVSLFFLTIGYLNVILLLILPASKLYKGPNFVKISTQFWKLDCFCMVMSR